MSFQDRGYELHLVLGDPAAPALWQWEVRQSIVPHLDPVFRDARGPTGVTSQQQDAPKHWLKFGRLGWNEKSHQRWTHGSPITAERSLVRRFFLKEACAPTRGACARDRKPPDVFLFSRNEGFWDEQGLSFNPTVLLAVAANLVLPIRKAADAAAEAIAGRTSARLRAFRNRPWGYPFGSQMMVDCVWDIVTTGLFKPGPVHRRRPSLDSLNETWQRRRSGRLVDESRPTNVR
jgi:hypothetical protein